MPRLWIITALTLLVTACSGQGPAATPPGDAGWITLFNGRDLAGWTKMHAGDWSVANGVLRYGGTGNGWIRSNDTFGDFHLIVEWRYPVAGGEHDAGLFFRAGTEGDIDELARIDREAFQHTPLGTDGMRARIAAADSVLVAMRGKTIAGFCISGMVAPDVGYIYVLAVGEEYRGEGIGASLTTRACKALFADGARRIDLTTDDDNGAAIRLYVRLGFSQTSAGREYARPVSEREIKRAQEKGEGVLIRFGGWR